MLDKAVKSSISGATNTVSLTVADNADRLLVVSIGVNSSNPAVRAITSVTYAGIPLTKLDASDTGAASTRSELWYLFNPPVGTANVVVTAGGSVAQHLTATSLYDMVQDAQPHTSNIANGSGSTASCSITTTVNNTVLIDSISCEPIPTVGSGQTLLATANQLQSFQNHAASSKDQASAGAGSMTWALSYGAQWRMVVGAFKHNPPHVLKTFTAKASVANPTKTFTSKARIKRSYTQTVTAKGRAFPITAGPLSTLRFRGIDVMKWTKDTTKGQPTDAAIENIVEFLQRNISLTHIGVVLPIDPLSWYPTSFVPASRSIVDCYQKWADEIHDRGLKILHRPVSFGMEGLEGFTHRVGGNRYYAGVKSEIIPTTFTDDFNRANIATAINQSSSSFSDDFNRASIGANWTPIGNWSLSSNQLVCDNVANATSNIIYTTTSFTDFNMTARIKKVSLSGFVGVAFRMSRNTNNSGRAFANYLSGYVLQLRGSNKLRVENIATSNLQEITKEWAVDSDYNVRIVCSGTNIKIKVWLVGSSEPGSWDMDFNDTTYASGGVGFVPENTNTRAIFDDLNLSYNPTTSEVSDWNKVGNWSIVSNALKCTNAAAQYLNLLYSKVTYRDFTFEAKIKTPLDTAGLTAVVFRLNPSNQFPNYSGYTARIKNLNTLQIEDLSVSTLGSVSKTYLPDTQYRIKVSCVGSSIQVKTWLDGDSEPGTWDLSITNTKYAQGSIGFAPENVTQAFFDDVTVTIASNYSSWLGIVYNFIVDNPDLFENGDMWAPFPERTEGIFSDSTSFLPNTSPGVQQNFANFFNDLKDVSDYAFSQIGKTGVLTGYTANNYSEVRSGWIPGSVFTKAGVTSFDYYQNYLQNNDFRGAQAKADLDAVYASKGNLPIVWQEWGPVPDMLTKINNNPTINGYGNVSGPNNANREVFIRDVYTNALAAALNEGKLEMFNYWGAWDTGDDDTGLFALSGTGTSLVKVQTYENIKFRREGWILAEYFSPGNQPKMTFKAKARVKQTATKTFTAKAKVVKTMTKTFTAQALVSNPTPDDVTIWTPIDETPTDTPWTTTRR